jgi:hypothetical protein
MPRTRVALEDDDRPTAVQTLASLGAHGHHLGLASALALFCLARHLALALDVVAEVHLASRILGTTAGAQAKLAAAFVVGVLVALLVRIASVGNALVEGELGRAFELGGPGARRLGGRTSVSPRHWTLRRRSRRREELQLLATVDVDDDAAEGVEADVELADGELVSRLPVAMVTLREDMAGGVVVAR